MGNMCGDGPGTSDYINTRTMPIKKIVRNYPNPEKGAEHYEIDQDIKKGAFGSVVLAKIKAQDNRPCAIKKISRDFLMKKFGDTSIVKDEKIMLEAVNGDLNIIKLL